MGSTRKIPCICFIATAVLTLIGAVLRSLCMLLCWDAEVGYFDFGVLPLLMNLTYPLAIGVAAISAILTPKDALPAEPRLRGRLPLAILMGVALVAFTAVSAVSLLTAKESDTPVSSLGVTVAVLALAAAVYFFLSAKRGGRYPDWLVAVGFVPIVWSMLAIAETYVDLFVAMNSPIKISLHLGLLGLMLILITELRIRLGKTFPRIAMALLSAGTFLCLTTAIPLLVSVGRDVFVHIRYPLYAAVLLCAGVYGGALLFSLVFPPRKENQADPEI